MDASVQRPQGRTTPAAPEHARFGHQPALDGLRAVAIAVVLAFHLGAGWMPGGYLGVSVFFTLSGFLITSLLLAERAAHRRIDLRRFYVRRARRLLPASLLCLAVVAALGSVGVFGDRDLGPEVLGALAQVANWEALVRDRPYGELFLAPSPLAHFWSLSIEEQLYWVWPLLLAGLGGWSMRRGRAGRAPLVPLALLFAVLAASAPLTARWLGSEAVYLATWTRAAEVVAGAVLAAALVGRRLDPRLRHLAPLALAAVVALCVLTPTVGGWPHAGGLPLFALVTVALLAGLQVDGPVRRALAVGPLVWVGRVSYGLYLYHWPIVVALDEARTGLDGPALAALRLAVTVAVAAASHRWVEQPIRHGTGFTPAPRLVLGWASCTLIVGGAVAMVGIADRQPAREATTPAAAPVTAPLARHGAPIEPADGSASVVAPVAVEPSPVVALLGDSVLDWLQRDAPAAGTTTGVVVVDGALEACDGAVERPAARDGLHRELPQGPDCVPWTASYEQALLGSGAPVDVAVVSAGVGAMFDHRLAGSWTGTCEDMAWYVADVEARLRYAAEHADEVVLLLPSWLGDRASYVFPNDHLARADCVRAALQRALDSTGGRVLDLAEVLCAEGPGPSCDRLRSTDGLHVDPEHAHDVLTWILERAVGPSGGAGTAGPPTKQAAGAGLTPSPTG